jgi:hypothetical protein
VPPVRVFELVGGGMGSSGGEKVVVGRGVMVRPAAAPQLRWKQPTRAGPSAPVIPADR